MYHDPRFRYFMAACPELEAAVPAGRIRDRLSLRSRVEDDRLHITLGITEESCDPSDWIPAAVEAALADHGLMSCPIMLGELKVEDNIAKLLPTGNVSELKALQAGVFHKLSRRGIAFRRPENFRPHMTLGYGPRFDQKCRIEPIRWRVTEIVLIESWIGKHVHRIVGRWELQPPSQHCFDFGLAA